MADKLNIPTHTLPDRWRELGAEKFQISPSMVEKIVYGTKINLKVFDFMLQMAESEKARKEQEFQQRKKRLAALTK